MRPAGFSRFAVLSCAVALALVAAAARADQTIAPNEPGVANNCYPFGAGRIPGNDWGPYTAFFYRDVYAFELRPGDLISFDLAEVNDADIELDIAMARTATNGGVIEESGFTTVVTNTQTPSTPRGDAVVGNFELTFAAEAPFDFQGGGLIIRFSNPSPGFDADATCTPVLVSALASDSSGHFVQRVFREEDGVSPWVSGGSSTAGFIGGFRITYVGEPPEVPGLSSISMAVLAAILASLGMLATVAWTSRERSQAR